MSKRNNKLLLKAYIDAYYVGSSFDKRSTSGHCTFSWVESSDWRTKKQNVVTRSSVESDFKAMTQEVYELL